MSASMDRAGRTWRDPAAPGDFNVGLTQRPSKIIKHLSNWHYLVRMMVVNLAVVPALMLAERRQVPRLRGGGPAAAEQPSSIIRFGRLAPGQCWHSG